ncbi:Protein kinase domain [Carpediemonas membranifera]|uniref:Protein kinase domain n=1 Tax=Carpediemonas membranifera TaxID=201153 RepID=A0A8J6B000_9EUKA|nr:Protein kinase domain [Carpediemonas membranifera]|eukprot:KAG9392553.1 Protein kinase domain [Carpediemonas membranifera]
MKAEKLPVPPLGTVGQYSDCQYLCQCCFASAVYLYSAIDPHTGREVSLLILKTITEHTMPLAEKEAIARLFERDYDILSSLDHQGILKPLAAPIVDSTFIAVPVEPVQTTLEHILSLVSEGPLLDLNRVETAPPAHLPRYGSLATPNMLLYGMSTLVNAIAYLYEHKLLHMNINPGSIFLTTDGRWLLGGFNYALELAPPAHSETMAEYDVFALPPHYWSGNALLHPCPLSVAPECMVGSVTPTSDVFSAGLVLLRMLGLVGPSKLTWTTDVLATHTPGRTERASAYRAMLHAIDPREFLRRFPEEAGVAKELFSMVRFDPQIRPRAADLVIDTELFCPTVGDIVKLSRVINGHEVTTSRKLFFLTTELPAIVSECTASDISDIIRSLSSIHRSSDPVVGPAIIRAFTILADKAREVSAQPSVVLGGLASNLASMVESLYMVGSQLTGTQAALLLALLDRYDAIVPLLRTTAMTRYPELALRAVTYRGHLQARIRAKATAAMAGLVTSEHSKLRGVVSPVIDKMIEGLPGLATIDAIQAVRLAVMLLDRFEEDSPEAKRTLEVVPEIFEILVDNPIDSPHEADLELVASDINQMITLIPNRLKVAVASTVVRLVGGANLSVSAQQAVTDVVRSVLTPLPTAPEAEPTPEILERPATEGRAYKMDTADIISIIDGFLEPAA